MQDYRLNVIILNVSHSVVSDSLWPHELWPARLLCPWEFSRQEYWSGLPCLPPGDLPNPGTEPRFPTLQADSLPSEPPGKPYHSKAPFNWLLYQIHGILNMCWNVMEKFKYPRVQKLIKKHFLSWKTQLTVFKDLFKSKMTRELDSEDSTAFCTDSVWLWVNTKILLLSCSVVSDSLWPHGL